VEDNPINKIDPDGRFDWNTLKQFSYGFCKTLDGIITSTDPIAFYNSGKTLATGVSSDIKAHNYSDAGKKIVNATGVPSLIETGKQALKGNPQAIGALTAVALVAVAAKNVGGETAATESEINITDDAFVHVTTPRGASNILSNGLDPKISGFVTKWKYVKNVTNPSEFNTMLYKQSAWPETLGKFDNGFSILKIDATPSFYSPRTNWINGIPQYKFNSSIDPSLITKIK
jgi:hypothetical protein